MMMGQRKQRGYWFKWLALLRQLHLEAFLRLGVSLGFAVVRLRNAEGRRLALVRGSGWRLAGEW